jgi:putative DNA primase/helicase
VLDVIVLADGDDPGEAAARDAALRWKREEHRVLIASHPHDLPKGRARTNGRRAT